ncbi:MAG: cysteine synthase family protein [Armatimonadetes bacterium]|nr:cysteine synthase family protein [Armatimonadota bacterium]
MITLLDAIGNTPLVELSRLTNGKVRILAKLEGHNPGGSVKDRPARQMVLAAEASGELTPDKVILEATSGNTGIGLAMVAAARGYRTRLTMPECVSIERRRILEAFGADIVLTPAAEGTDGAIREAHRLLESDPDRYYMPNQFDNPANVQAHYEATGPEILRDTNGDVDAFVAGLGTSGTLMGAGRRLKEADPATLLVGVEPPLGHRIQGLKNMTESIVPAIYRPEVLDDKVTVTDNEAFAAARELSLKEGLFVGMSSGAALAGALQVAERLGSGTVVTIFPDRGERYLSTVLFRSVCADCPP